MLTGFNQPRKVPRLLLAQGDEPLTGLIGVKAIWPDNEESIVYDLSYSGMAISSHDQLSKIKPGQIVEFRLRVPGIEDPVPVRTRAVRLQARSLGFVFESVALDERLVLEQSLRDRIIGENLQENSQSALAPNLRGDMWLHGPFDTNVLLWLRAGTHEIQRALVEYENLVWIYEDGELILQKTQSAIEESRGYYNSTDIFNPKLNKVSMGASWLDRLLKLLEPVNLRRNGDLTALMDLLRSQRQPKSLRDH